MIFTVTTIIVLVVGILSLALALYGGFIASDMLEDSRENLEEYEASEQKYYLLSMIGIIVLLGRLLIVPVFFWMLQSLVPFCPGAMCAYGVMNVGSPYSFIDLTLKIVLPFAYGAWIVLELANRTHPELPLMTHLARSFLLILLPMVVIEAALDVLFVATVKPVFAPCCGSVYDVDPPFSPSSLFGPEFGMFLLVVLVILASILILVQWSPIKPRARSVPILILALSAGLVYLFVLHDTYAPLVLGLPDHHCPYCLFQEFPDTAFFTVLFWVGIASAGWRAIMEWSWQHQSLNEQSITPLSTVLLKVSTVCILFSMVSLLSHFLVAITG